MRRTLSTNEAREPGFPNHMNFPGKPGANALQGFLNVQASIRFVRQYPTGAMSTRIGATLRIIRDAAQCPCGQNGNGVHVRT